MTLSDEAWEQRVLCSDGNCIGVIGSDGRCKACGKAYTGDLPLPLETDETDEVEVDAAPAMPAAAEPVTPDDAPPAEDPDDGTDAWERRTLCVDESCIGVVGPDGRCKECGKPYPG